MIVLGYAGRGNGDELESAGAQVFADMVELPDLLDQLTAGKRP